LSTDNDTLLKIKLPAMIGDNRTDLINCDYASRHWYNGPTSYERIVDPII